MLSPTDSQVEKNPIIEYTGESGNTSEDVVAREFPLTIILNGHDLVTLLCSPSEVFGTTGGVHSAALCDPKHILVFYEDVGRHNAVDKIFGKCLIEDIFARRDIPILTTKSAPNGLGVKLSEELGMTLISFVRGQRMNVYANEWRLNNA